MASDPGFNIVEASIEDHRKALESGRVTSVELCISYLNRIATYDICGGLHAFTIFNPHCLDEATASDARRAAGHPPRPLEGIPYTIKDSYKYEGLTVTNGSPALKGLMSSSESALAGKIRAAGAVMLGKTNMPPMAAGGMQRGMYGRAESPYNSNYLTAAFSSGSSNGAATSTASSMAVFGLGSETVSSGRSPASNNALIAYTPSRGVLSCRGLWPLYVTCDTPVPYTRSMSDMFDLLSVIAEPDEETKGDFWREQKHVELPQPHKVDYKSLEGADALKGKRIGVPKIYIGLQDSSPHSRPVTVHPSVTTLWQRTRADLEALGAEIIYTDFPLVTNYENDSLSNEANNVVGAPSNWNEVERSLLIAKAWDTFLVQNENPKIPNLESVDPKMLFPKPEGYIPDNFLEVRNWIHYDRLPKLAAENKDVSIFDLPGLKQALISLEAQRRRDLEDWMDELKLDCVAFPANGDVGLADLEFNLKSATHSLKNGVKYSNGNRAIRHLGVPTISVPMGILQGREMPINLTFIGKAYDDDKLLAFAYAYEQGSKRRISPPLTPALETDTVAASSAQRGSVKKDKVGLTASVESDGDKKHMELRVFGNVVSGDGADLEVFVDGRKAWKSSVGEGAWEAKVDREITRPDRLGWDLKPLKPWPAMVLVVARSKSKRTACELLWI